MKEKHAGPTARRIDHRRIGKKVLSCSRTASLLYGELEEKVKKWRLPRLALTKKQTIILSCVVATLLIGSASYIVYGSYQAEQQRIAREEKEKRNDAARIKSNECRAQKLASKSDQIGKITYDELYDYTVCDYLER